VGSDTPFQQPAADGVHEGQRTTEVVERVVGELDGREIHDAVVDAVQRQTVSGRTPRAL